MKDLIQHRQMIPVWVYRSIGTLQTSFAETEHSGPPTFFNFFPNSLLLGFFLRNIGIQGVDAKPTETLWGLC